MFSDEAKKKNINFDNILSNQEEDKKLEKQIEKKMNTSKVKNDNFEKEIKAQEKKMSTLDQEIAILKAKLKHKNKQIYIVEEQMKQIQKYQEGKDKDSSYYKFWNFIVQIGTNKCTIVIVYKQLLKGNWTQSQII